MERELTNEMTNIGIPPTASSRPRVVSPVVGQNLRRLRNRNLENARIRPILVPACGRLEWQPPSSRGLEKPSKPENAESEESE